MSNTLARSRSSSGVSRSNRSVPRPASVRTSATCRLGGCAGCCRCRGRRPRSPGVLRHGQADNAGAGLDFLAPGRRVSRARGARGAGLCRGLRRGRAIQAGHHVLIGHLGELGVELPDSKESPWRVHAGQPAGIRAGPCPPPRRRDGHGEHHPRRPLRPDDLAGGPGHGPGGDVDQGREYRLDDFGPDSGLIAGRSGAVLWHGRRLRGADMTGRWFCLMARPGFGTWAAEPGPGGGDPCPVVGIPSPHRGGGGERERGVHLGYA